MREDSNLEQLDRNPIWLSYKNKLIEDCNKLKKRPTDVNCEIEINHLFKLLQNDLKINELCSEYNEPKVEGIGGSGIVISAVYKPFNNRRAFKFPREKLFKSTNNEPLDIDPELHALSKVSHKNITRLYDSVQISNTNLYCVVTEYVDTPSALDEYIKKICCSERCQKDFNERNLRLRQFAHILYDIIDALVYMHYTAKLIHFDLKPDNILISKQGVPYITDLGFARDLLKYKKDELIDVGFTWKYAHFDLGDTEKGAKVTNVPEKSRIRIKLDENSRKYDLFAFARSVQETLKQLENEYGEEIHSNYIFNYLHLISCLCLDGKNASDDSLHKDLDFISDTALGVEPLIFEMRKLKSFKEVKTIIERLLGYKQLEFDLPELDSWSSNTINTSDLGITTITPRVTTLINHPVFQRLKGEKQLGMMDSIFPLADHNRFQHSLGVYHASCEYIKALYYNNENPTFRIFYKSDSCKKLLLSVLLHDVGQTGFGHELEETDGSEFAHEDIGSFILRNDKCLDNNNKTIKELVEDEGFYAWGIDLENLISFMKGDIEDPFEYVLYDIFDGQIDADKFDYLIRDSVEARVNYGKGIDYYRFLRSLTTCTIKDKTGKPSIRLAIKRKGAASAEAIALGRYQLYQSLYWHHTFRAIKAMFSIAATNIKKQTSIEYKDLFINTPLKIGYLLYVLGIEKESFKKSSQIEPIVEKIKSFRTMATKQYNSVNKTVEMFWNFADDNKSKVILEDIMKRQYYKRVFEVSLSDLSENAMIELLNIFKNDLHSFQIKIEDAMLNLLKKKIQDESKSRVTLVEDELLKLVAKFNAEYYCFIVDFPTRGWSVKGEAPFFVSDYKRRHFRSFKGDKKGLEKSILWEKNLGDLMKQIAFFRIYSHPNIHSLLRKVTSSEDIKSTIFSILPT